MHISLPTSLAASWQPWHVALAFTVLCAVLAFIARAQLLRAREDWANAYFYSPSQKPKVRKRRQQWQDRTWALAGCTALGMVTTAVLYWFGRT